MGNTITIGVIGSSRCATLINVSEDSVIKDKSKIIPRIKTVTELFTQHIDSSKIQDVLDSVIENTLILDGTDPKTQYFLKGHQGAYSPSNGKTYLDLNHLDTPALVEHETLHLLGYKYLKPSKIPRRIINQPEIAANALDTLLDIEDIFQDHQRGIATDIDFFMINLYKLIPIEFQEKTPGFRKTCYKIGNYARETDKGMQFIYDLCK